MTEAEAKKLVKELWHSQYAPLSRRIERLLIAVTDEERAKTTRAVRWIHENVSKGFVRDRALELLVKEGFGR